jgi:hypothetical protein
MFELLFILVVTGLCIIISRHFSPDEITWLTYYWGVMSGLLMSGVSLGCWNKWRRKKEEQNQEKRKPII